MGNDAVKIFKALSDSSRLEIVRTLANGPMYVELLASRLDLTPSTVSFHLKKLEEAGLISSSRDQYYMLYEVNQAMLGLCLKDMIGRMDAGSEPDRREQEYRQKVIRSFYEYGKLKSLPVQHKKRRIILEEIAKLFRAGRTYTEKEVNIAIADVFDDFCTVRRDMISEGLMSRSNGIYQLIHEPERQDDA